MDQLCFVLDDIRETGETDEPEGVIEELITLGFITETIEGEYELTRKGEDYLMQADCE